MIIGSTGFTWQQKHLQQLEREQKKWIHGHNFSLAMNLVRKLLGLIGNAQEVLGKMSFHIHEVHHEKKLDAPSGTALKWQQWLGVPKLDITYARQGDTIGIHELSIIGGHGEAGTAPPILGSKSLRLWGLMGRPKGAKRPFPALWPYPF